MGYLSQQDLLKLAGAMANSGLDTNNQRPALVAFVPAGLVNAMSTGHAGTVQVIRDLSYFNEIDHLADGSVPLETYLRNAEVVFAGREDILRIIRELLSKVVQRSTGAPKIDVAAMPEMREKIVHTDDLVTFAFMSAGVAAAASVLKLRVTRYEGGQAVVKNGKPVRFLGTGWLLARGLVMTNHHVVNAREDGEPDATEQDLRLQGAGTVGFLDFDADEQEGVEVAVSSLEAWNAELDYAILRVAPIMRTPLRRARTPITKGVDPVPINIIQHPGGRGKRYGIRNNLLHKVAPKELFYFTDTEGGSSGSPVFDDNWEVVGLHRASRYVDDVQFQGKATAYVNLGTPITPIEQDITQRFPALATEIAQ